MQDGNTRKHPALASWGCSYIARRSMLRSSWGGGGIHTRE